MEPESAWEVSISFGETCDLRISLAHIQSLGKLTNLQVFNINLQRVSRASLTRCHKCKSDVKKYIILSSLLMRKRWKYDNIPRRNANYCYKGFFIATSTRFRKALEQPLTHLSVHCGFWWWKVQSLSLTLEWALFLKWSLFSKITWSLLCLFYFHIFLVCACFTALRIGLQQL